MINPYAVVLAIIVLVLLVVLSLIHI